MRRRAALLRTAERAQLVAIAVLAVACGASRPPAPETPLPPEPVAARFVRRLADLPVERGQDASLAARMLVGPGGLESDRAAVAWFQIAEDHAFGAAHPCFDLHGVVLSGEANLLDPRGVVRIAAGDGLFVPRRYPFVMVANGGPFEILQIFAADEGVRACDDSVRERAEDMPPPEDREGLVALQHLVRAADAPFIPLAQGQARVQMLVDADAQGARLAYAGQFVAEPGLRLPAHAHDDADEILFVREGRGTLTIEGERVALEPQTVVRIPAGTLHSFEADATAGFAAVHVYAGPGPAERFRSARDAAGL